MTTGATGRLLPGDSLFDRRIGVWPLIAFLCIAVVVSFALHLPARYGVTWDMSTYLANARFASQAAALAEGDMFATSRGGYIGMLAVLLALPGEPLLNLALFQTACAALLAAALGWLAWRTVGCAAACGTLGLWLSSSDLLWRLPLVIDPIWPLCILGALLLLWRADDELVSPFALGAAGGLVGLGLAIKEAAAPFLLLPMVLAGLKVIRLRPSGLLAWLAMAAAIYLAIGAAAPSVAPLTERGAAYGSGGGLLSDWVMREVATAGGLSIATVAGLALEAMHAYFLPTYRGPGLFSVLPLLPLCAAGLLWGAWRWAKRGDRAAGLLVITCVLSLPLAAISGLMGLRPTQNLLLIGVGLMLAAGLLVQLAVQVLERIDAVPATRPPRPARVLLLAGLLVAAAVVYGDQRAKLGLVKWAQRSASHRLVSGKARPLQVTVPGQAVAHWIKEHLPRGSTVMVENVAVRYGTAFLLGPAYRILPVPLENAGFTPSWPYYPPMRETPGRPLDFVALSSPRPGEFLNILLGARSEMLNAGMEKFGRPHVAIADHGYGLPLSRWLTETQGYEPVASITGRTPIESFVILRPPPEAVGASGHRFVDQRVLDHLQRLAESHAARLHDWHVAFVQALLGVEVTRPPAEPAACAGRPVLVCY